jgi:hypothetical protein
MISKTLKKNLLTRRSKVPHLRNLSLSMSRTKRVLDLKLLKTLISQISLYILKRSQKLKLLRKNLSKMNLKKNYPKSKERPNQQQKRCKTKSLQ